MSRDAHEPPDPMSWEDAPRPHGLRRWLMPLIAGAVVVAVAALVLASRSGEAGRLAIQPTAAPRDRSAAEASESTALSPRALSPFAVATETAGDGPLLDGAPDLTLVVGHRERLALIEVATGDTRQMRLPRSRQPPPGLDSMFRVGSDLIVNHHNAVIRVTPTEARPTQIAVNRHAIPTFDDRSLWVVDELVSAIPTTATRVAPDGSVIDRVRLPAVARPIAGRDDGLLVSAPGGVGLVSGDDAAEVTSTGELVATDGERIARVDCEAAVRCLIVLGTLDDPDQVRAQLAEEHIPAGYYGLPIGAYSPDGRWLALPLYQVDNVGALERPWIAVIDTLTASEVTRVQGPFTQGFSALPLAWSANSEWLFVGSEDGITTWNATDGQTRPLRLNMEAPRAIAVLG